MRTKADIINSILEKHLLGGTFQPDSGIIKCAVAGLQKMNRFELDALLSILTYK